MLRVLALVLCIAASLYAAIDRGAIQGTVDDPQQAVVPGVRVEVKNLATGVVTTTTTNDTGAYLVSELLPGTYQVRFVAKGFSTMEISNVEVKAGSKVTLDTVVKPGEVVEHLDVRSEAVLLETTASKRRAKSCRR